MGVGPVPATEKVLARTGLTIGDIGLFEINEAFAVQVLAFLDHFGIKDDDERVNPDGGAIALGHPLASSGVRLMTQMAPLRGAPRGSLRADHDVRRHRHGRLRRVGEPAARGLRHLQRQGEGRVTAQTALPTEIVTQALVRDVVLPAAPAGWP